MKLPFIDRIAISSWIKESKSRCYNILHTHECRFCQTLCNMQLCNKQKYKLFTEHSQNFIEMSCSTMNGRQRLKKEWNEITSFHSISLLFFVFSFRIIIHSPHKYIHGINLFSSCVRVPFPSSPHLTLSIMCGRIIKIFFGALF